MGANRKKLPLVLPSRRPCMIRDAILVCNCFFALEFAFVSKATSCQHKRTGSRSVLLEQTGRLGKNLFLSISTSTLHIL